MAGTYLLYESAAGYALFLLKESNIIAQGTDAVRSSVQDPGKFKKMIELQAFQSFASAAAAFHEINCISDGTLSESLKDFLSRNLPSKKKAFDLGVLDHSLAQAIHKETAYKVQSGETIQELSRGIRLHFGKFVNLKAVDIEKAELGLSHSFSRAKVKFNVNKVDNMIIQAICLLDTLDKDINTYTMRIKEWYGWHFPELLKVISESNMYLRLVSLIRDKSTFNEDKLDAVAEIVGDESQAKLILEACRSSMGVDLSPIDLISIEKFTTEVIDLMTYRESLHTYLVNKMNTVAPNLAALIGEMVGARLISHAGSLISLAKYPASTVQILGAEKALFRALKTRGKTPKYGLIFNSTFIGRAAQKNKGRISRYLANKCSIASRIDSFADFSNNTFGLKLRDQVEERLAFYDSGVTPRKNIDVMKEALASIGVMDVETPAKVKKSDATSEKKKKQKKESAKKEKPQKEKSKKEDKSKKEKSKKEDKGEKRKRKEEKEEKKSSKKTPSKKKQRTA